MEKVIYLVVFMTLFLASIVFAQSSEHEPHFSFRELQKREQSICQDTLNENTLADALRKGAFEMKMRSFLMLTDNDANLPDYYALALGAGMHYKSKHWKGFHIGIGGFFKFNIFSNELNRSYASQEWKSRYELALFDVQNPDNHHDLDRLEELYVAYNNKSLALQLGRFSLKMPYINPQDGRMRPTIEEGLHLEWQAHKNLRAQVAYIWAISPRSTVEFFSIAHSLGIYSQGIDTRGNPANYFGHQHTKGVFLGDITYTLTKHLALRLHQQYVENIFSTSMLSAEYAHLDSESFAPIFGFQYHFQHQLGNGGNKNSELAYYQDQNHAQAWSFRVGAGNKKHWLTANYTRMTEHGRFLLPREWGREPFFTFMPRERNEGMGDVNAFSMKYHSFWLHHRLSLALSYGYFDTPNTKKYTLNKYELPSYHQVNLDLRYRFTHYFEGLEVQFLITRKQAQKLPENSYLVFNKVNLNNYNFVINYHFGK